MRIGIIAAMSAEKELIEKEMTNVLKEPYRSFVFVCGTISNNEIILVQSGVGKVNSSVAVTLLASKYECSLIINTGIAGGIMPLQTKDVVIATKLSYSDVDATAFGYKYGQVPSMPQFYTPQDGGVLLVKESFNKFCKTCNEDICILCESKHKGHNIFELAEIIIDKNDLNQYKKGT